MNLRLDSGVRAMQAEAKQRQRRVARDSSAKAINREVPTFSRQYDDPWKIEGEPVIPDDCECPPKRTPSRPKPERPESKPKDQDCCRQILELMRCIPGIDERCLHLHKPKVSSKVK